MTEKAEALRDLLAEAMRQRQEWEDEVARRRAETLRQDWQKRVEQDAQRLLQAVADNFPELHALLKPDRQSLRVITEPGCPQNTSHVELPLPVPDLFYPGLQLNFGPERDLLVFTFGCSRCSRRWSPLVSSLDDLAYWVTRGVPSHFPPGGHACCPGMTRRPPTETPSSKEEGAASSPTYQEEGREASTSRSGSEPPPSAEMGEEESPITGEEPLSKSLLLKAMTLCRRAYHESVRLLAETLQAEIDSGEIPDEQALQDRLREAALRHQVSIYPDQALECLRWSENADAYFETRGPLEAAACLASSLWPKIASAAFEADVRESLEQAMKCDIPDYFDRWDRAPAREGDEARVVEDYQDEDYVVTAGTVATVQSVDLDEERITLFVPGLPVPITYGYGEFEEKFETVTPSAKGV